MLFDRSSREFFWLLVRRDLKVRYAGSTLGGLWNLIHPLVMIGIYMTVFSSLMREKYAAGMVVPYYGGMVYGVHLVAGMLPWLLFSDVLTRSTGVLLENSNFLKKVSFPPLVLYLSVLFNALLVNGAGYLCFLGIVTLLGKTPPALALAGLGMMLLIGLVGMGLGLILSGVNVFLRDTGQVVTVVMQVLFWFAPIVYYKEKFYPVAKAAAAVTDAGRSSLEAAGRLILSLNPLERFITATQWFFGHDLVRCAPTALDWAIIALFPPLCLAAGLWLFRRMLPEVRDCL